MKILAFETATEACSVALHVDGAVIARHEIAPRRHAELALPWAEALLAEAGITRKQLDAIALSSGPGAFTGVRLGIAIAQGIALALDKPVLPISTLHVLAMRAQSTPPQPILAAIDARMGEIYAAAFEWRNGELMGISHPVVLAPDQYQLPEHAQTWSGVGTGFAASEHALSDLYRERFAQIDAEALPQASDLLVLALQAYARGEAVAPEMIEPAYLRNNVALTLREQKAARGE